jgi:hypothetical protein
MKKLVFASVMALASISLVSAPTLRAQDSITIKDPAEFNAYQMATRRAIQGQGCGSGEFSDDLSAERRQERSARLLIDTYQGLGDADQTLSAASRLLQVDPNNMKAIFISVLHQEGQCGKDRSGVMTRRPATMPRRWPRRA